MIATIKAEFRKLLTVRSTYVIFGIAILLAILFAFYIEGYKAGATVGDQNKLASEVTSAISSVAMLGALVGVLLVTHEYRYNTIMYTLTASKSRTRVFVAKIIAVTCFAVVFALILGAISPMLTYLGVSLKGLHLVHQDIAVWSLLWRAVFAGWGFAMIAFILASIIRIQVGAIAALFLIPSMVEGLLGLLLKNNVIYLPFNSLNAVLMHNGPQSISYRHAAVIVLAYIVGGSLIAWQLFVRRDAN